MDRLELMGVVSLFGVLLALPPACNGSSFSAAEGGSSNGSGGSKGGSAGKSGGQGGSPSQGGSTGEAGSVEPGTGGGVGSAGDVGVGGDPGLGAGGSAIGTGGGGMTDAATGCGFGSIQFQMKPAVNSTQGSFCTESCIPWVTVFSHGLGKWLSLSNDCGVNECASCTLPPCVDIACIPQTLPSEGIEMTWDGTNYAGNSCLSDLGIQVACNEPVCLPYGSYEARMCAYIKDPNNPDACGGDPAQACKDVTFEFMGGEIIVSAEISL